jgi:hypothetical protein
MTIRHAVSSTGSLAYASLPTGKMEAVSLHVFDPEGEQVFESYGGLDLVHEADAGNALETLHVGWRLMPHRLEDEDALRAGIALAFEPTWCRLRRHPSSVAILPDRCVGGPEMPRHARREDS